MRWSATRFETYVPDLKAVAEFKTNDIDTYLASVASFTSPKENGP